MNGIKTRSYVVAGLVGLGGLLTLGSSQGSAAAPKTEAFLEDHAPSQVPGYLMVPSEDGSRCYTYKMDEGTYKTLKPFGIVAREFETTSGVFDSVLISSNDHESFHDPRICFSAQGFTLGDQHVENMEIPGRGAIPFTVVEMDGPRGKSIAMYTYHGPGGFVATSKQLQLDMFKEVVFGHKPVDSTFYRFMPASVGVGLPELKTFVKSFMTAAEKSSGGYF